jgi:hypothetical protein
MRHVVALLVALSSAMPAFAQTPTVAFAEEAAIRALDFHQGDLASLTDARENFTPEGWSAFLKHMDGWLDPRGAPTFSSRFEPSGNAVILGTEKGVVNVSIPGTLKQTQNTSSTTYRAAVEVHVGGSPPKIQLLEQITCPKESAGCR